MYELIRFADHEYVKLPETLWTIFTYEFSNKYVIDWQKASISQEHYLCKKRRGNQKIHKVVCWSIKVNISSFKNGSTNILRGSSYLVSHALEKSWFRKRLGIRYLSVEFG